MNVCAVRWASPLLGLLMACSGMGEEPATRSADSSRAATCPAEETTPWPLPGTAPKDEDLSTWLDRYDPAALDEPIMAEAAIAAYNREKGRLPGEHPFAQRDLSLAPDADTLREDLLERMRYMHSRVDEGLYLSRTPQQPLESAAFDVEKVAVMAPELRVALSAIPLRCGPYPAPLFKAQGHDTLDRNACSTIHSQEPVQVLARHSSGMRLVRTRYAMGFIDESAALSPPLSKAESKRLLAAPRDFTEEQAQLSGIDNGIILERHSTVARTRSDALLVATEKGLVEAKRPASVRPAQRPLTRRALLTSAFSFLGEDYGFGGQDGGRDCSRLQLDLFESFDLALPRHSGWQAQAGTDVIDLEADASPQARMDAIDAANRRGVTLLHLPGHIMLYLGRNDRGEPMALHALGEYAQPCPGGGETVRLVRKVVVSDLQLGAGSSRRSLLERLTKVIVFSSEPASAPKAAVPPEDACEDDTHHRIFFSPATPQVGKPLRVMATTSEAVAKPELRILDASGTKLPLQVRKRLGGPPFTELSTVEPAAPGRLTVGLYDGAERVACKRVAVILPRPPEAESAPAGSPVWTPRWKWEADTENLWAAFIEQLFDDPATDETTWSDLHSLLRDPERNLLLNHLGQAEDDTLTLNPDCADLPYMLRAYFAWKLRLPFAFRRCSRGRPGRPPSCGPLRDNLMERKYVGDEDAFDYFASRTVRSGVHSASGRTAPDDDDTDLYPVPLERRHLAPGTVYADPYGHVLMISKWYRQGSLKSDPYGVLMAAEAQPDGTIGRRRFWEGSFLFDPSTKDVGAGFKHFRPLTFDRATGTIKATANADIGDGGAPFSKQQYGLSPTEFYERMDALINPRPLDPVKRQLALVDALEEGVRRRLTSVDNAIQYMKRGGAMPIEMPQGYAIFETTGAWEDYSSPARDMRLLIAIDTVMSFPEKVARAPERYVVRGKQPDVAALRKALRTALEARTFEYERSDGSKQTLTLADVVDRRGAFEMAYNPNDCVELRWAAPEGSKELRTCKRHAPADQRTRMEGYRSWFQKRHRPPRGT